MLKKKKKTVVLKCKEIWRNMMVSRWIKLCLQMSTANLPLQKGQQNTTNIKQWCSTSPETPCGRGQSKLVVWPQVQPLQLDQLAPTDPTAENDELCIIFRGKNRQTDLPKAAQNLCFLVPIRTKRWAEKNTTAAYRDFDEKLWIADKIYSSWTISEVCHFGPLKKAQKGPQARKMRWVF